ncbi:MAG: cell surface protein SprA [Bacteroidota bacterium]
MSVIWINSAKSYSRKAYLFDFQQSTAQRDTTKTDSVKQDSLKNRVYQPSRKPTFNPRDRFGDPFSNNITSSPLFIKEPSSLKLDVEIDTGLNYTIYEKIGDVNYRPTTTMSFDEFENFQRRRLLKDYWKTRSAGLDGESAVSGRNLIPKIYVSPVLDRIFGGSEVEIIPRGFVTLDFGGRWQRLDNPAIPIRQQRNGGFEFDQQINMNIVGKIGEKLAVTANFDNNNSFDFENNLKVEYTGFEEDILKKLEIGNVSLPLNNSLITGAQNLFGIKAQMQFGKLYVTSVASTQRGKSESIQIEGGGAQGRQFEIIASNYDENRHFFLGHFFRDNYERWLAGIPQVLSGVNITRVEVYVVNRNNDTETLRNVVGFMDLGEPSRIFNEELRLATPFPDGANDNNANDLGGILGNLPRDANTINETLSTLAPYNFQNGTGFERINGARKLAPNEYTINTQLGYISLFRKLQNDEALAVAYEYTFNGQVHRVGELTEDYATRGEDEVIFLKLLRPRSINIRDANGGIIPSWDLMMKNIYSLNASQLSREGFQLRVIYRDDRTGIDNPQLQEGATARTRQLIEILGLDRLNPNGDPQRDGNFDYVEGVTVNSQAGLIIFPFLEPFDDPLRAEFANDPEPTRTSLIERFVFDTLYRTTRAEAELDANRNKYFLVGSVQSGSSSEIVLPGFNIAEGSVRVSAGGAPLTEGVDYQVDYNFGRVTIINEGVLNSGKNINISYEKADLFNFQTRTLLGTRLDYRLSDDINFGATLLHLNERPLISRISIGNEPTRNTKYGFDVNLNKESRLLTKMLDALPVFQTKEPSNVTFSAEYARLVPGTSNIVDGEGTSYIDDFENTVTPFNLGNPNSWRLAATPETSDDRFDLSNGSIDDIRNGFKRAKLAWYTVDNLFYRRGTGGTFGRPSSVPDDITNHYERGIIPQEIFTNQDRAQINTNLPIFDMAYFPEERGQYNYNDDLNPDGTLKNPRSNWGGITNAIRSEVDFDKANIEYIEFWLMDPFINSTNGRIDDPDGLISDGVNAPSANTTGGQLIFNLGSVSEDVIRDGRHAFENGLPRDQQTTGGVTSNSWGVVTTQQFLTNAFDNSEGARQNQDVGLDGISTETEKILFQESFLDKIRDNNLDPEAINRISDDPAADDFQYFLDESLTDESSIVVRYKDFNNLENNSPAANTTGFVASGSTLPDNEDLNVDNTLSELEEYYEYQISLDPRTLGVNSPFVVDRIVNTTNNGMDEVNWYLFRIPIRQFTGRVGNINGFKSIRYVRTYMTGFSEPVVLRMANFRLVGSQWRRFTGNLEEARFGEPIEPDISNFIVSAVNIEENGQGNETQSPYVLPPGFRRDRDNTSTVERRLNEQSIQLCVDDLEDGDARAIFKNVGLDLINYGRVKMFLHANSTAGDGELTAFLRLGTDFDQNYYEIEVPLTISPLDIADPEIVWPQENEIDIDVNELYALKSERNRNNAPLDQPFPAAGPKQVGRHLIRIVGRPDMSAVRTMMIGIRNPISEDGMPQDVCLWANELRVTDFNQDQGWAANATLNTKLADFANVTASTRHTTFGFGGIQSRIAERTREETTSYDISANISLDKLLPEKLGLKIPMFVSYEKTNITPFFDPRDPDIPLEASLLSFGSIEEQNEYRNTVRDQTVRRSINFTNVRKEKVNPDAKRHIYDFENLSFTYAYSETRRSNVDIADFLRQSYRGGVAYNYSPNNQPWEPFAKSNAFKSPYLKLIKDLNFNPLPSNISVRFDLDRQFTRTRFRDEFLEPQPTANFEKFFNFNRTYNVRWGLTKSLTLDYSARANATVDEPDGDIDTREERQIIWENIRDFGRMRNFDQNITATYRLPLDKLPVTDWLNADYRYGAGFTWTAGPRDEPDTAGNVVLLPDSLNFGNIIQNNRTRGATGKIDLVKLYNKVKILKDINSPPRRGRSSRNPRNKPDTTQTNTNENKALKGILRFLMSVRSINATYNVTEGTLLPGFTPTPRFFGMDDEFAAPGASFILGSQNPDIRNRAAENDWLRRVPALTTPFTQTQTVDLSIRASLEPFKDFKVQLDAKKTENTSYQEIFRFDDDISEFRSLNPSRGGSYAVSFLTISTAFLSDDEQNNNPAFTDFESHRDVIRRRLTSLTGNEYDTSSQDVLIPAFIAAYTGQDPSEVNLSPFPRNPIPNWRVDYAGLGKIPALKEIFASVNITHGYQSNYTVNNYTSSLRYDSLDLTTSFNVEDYNDGQFASVPNDDGTSQIPLFVISQVTISEQFSPLIGINMRTKSRMNIRLDYKRKRDLALNLSNSQITELRSNDVAFELGFTKSDMKLPFKSRGRTIVLKNDLNFRMTFTVRDTRTVQRKIKEINTITNGDLNFRFRPQVNYAVNEKLNMQFYFERTINEPRISSSFRRSTTAGGIQVRFSLSQ